jgi:hypothetical protein
MKSPHYGTTYFPVETDLRANPLGFPAKAFIAVNADGLHVCQYASFFFLPCLPVVVCFFLATTSLCHLLHFASNLGRHNDQRTIIRSFFFTEIDVWSYQYRTKLFYNDGKKQIQNEFNSTRGPELSSLVKDYVFWLRLESQCVPASFPPSIILLQLCFVIRFNSCEVDRTCVQVRAVRERLRSGR